MEYAIRLYWLLYGGYATGAIAAIIMFVVLTKLSRKL